MFSNELGQILCYKNLLPCMSTLHLKLTKGTVVELT